LNYGIGICPVLQLVISLCGDFCSPNCVWPRPRFRGTGVEYHAVAIPKEYSARCEMKQFCVQGIVNPHGRAKKRQRHFVVADHCSALSVPFVRNAIRIVHYQNSVGTELLTKMCAEIFW
jgi:hypothetical protein